MWLSAFGIDANVVDALSLARVLPDDPVPEWARYGRTSWVEGGYRLLVPLYDTSGAISALYARSLRPLGNRSGRRSLPAVSGAGCFVMANRPALGLLRTASWPAKSEWNSVLVVGGAVDFLDWATSVHVEPIPVLGLVPGSWSPAMAARIPNGSRVILRTHKNPIAGRYAHQLAASLHERCEVVVRNC